MDTLTVSITPQMIDTSNGLEETFGKHEVEFAASTLTRLSQHFNQWQPFTKEQLAQAILAEHPDYNRSHPQEGVKRPVRKLLESRFVEKLPSGKYLVTELFVLRAFVRHPAKAILFPYLTAAELSLMK